MSLFQKEEKTLALNDTVLLALKGWEGKNITAPEFWTSDVPQSLSGRCYTLDLDINVIRLKILDIQLNTELSILESHGGTL